MDGISRREVARRAGVDEATVRKLIRDGALKKAMLPNGSLHPERALKLISENVQSGKKAPAAITSAKNRRLRAQVIRLSDEVIQLRRTAIPADDAFALMEESHAFIAKCFSGFAWDAANSAAGKTSAAAHQTVRDLIYGGLERCSAPTVSENPVPETSEDLVVDIGALSANDLTARRIALQAEKMEIENALSRGELRLVYDVVSDFEEKLGVSKSLLMAIPGRVSQQAATSTPEAFEALVQTEVDTALAELA